MKYTVDKKDKDQNLVTFIHKGVKVIRSVQASSKDELTERCDYLAESIRNKIELNIITTESEQVKNQPILTKDDFNHPKVESTSKDK